MNGHNRNTHVISGIPCAGYDNHMDRADEEFPGIGAPAQRALAHAGYTRLEQLDGVSESDLLELHGMGPTGTDILSDLLNARGMSLEA